MRKLNVGEYNLKACLGADGKWSERNYEQEYTKDVFLIGEKAYSDGTNTTDLFLVVNSFGYESMWSGDLIKETKKIETRLTF